MEGVASAAETRGIGDEIAPPSETSAAAPAQPSLSDGRSAVLDATTATLDRELHAAAAPFTGGLSPAALSLAFADSLIHLATAPGKRLGLARDALSTAAQLAQQAAQLSQGFRPWSLIAPPSHDRRFSGADWTIPPFNLAAQGFLLAEQWWQAATEVRGVSRDHAAITAFALRQILDTVAPTNFALSNPEVIRKTVETGGRNFIDGYQNWLKDLQALSRDESVGEDQRFVVGRDVATAPGKVVFRNHLIELIQYEPATGTVYPEPILIVPAWIMKYYILDLSPHNSLVRYLTAQGFTVFMISWRNPTAADRDLSLEDYRTLGVEAALASIQSIVPGRCVHAAGYCLGGTLLAIAAAAMSPERRAGLCTITLLAAQTDFTEAGELTLFINESQISFLEDVMRHRGVLASQQMAGAFQMLRSNDLFWSRVVRGYLMGERTAPSDLMAWNADATRMPARMHSEYLRKLFLDNDLAEGRYVANGRPVALSDLHAPMFVVGTLRDHVAPWRSVHKIHFLADADVTFVVASGGHNAGIVAPPGQQGHSYQLMGKAADGPYVGPDEWMHAAPVVDGSWWPAWAAFLALHSGVAVAPPAFPSPPDGGPLSDAPGLYVRQH
jgi:polyhydroxyalkanoate synthase